MESTTQPPEIVRRFPRAVQELPTVNGSGDAQAQAAAPQKVKILLDGANMAWAYGTAVRPPGLMKP